jgi:hypothetical protein
MSPPYYSKAASIILKDIQWRRARNQPAYGRAEEEKPGIGGVAAKISMPLTNFFSLLSWLGTAVKYRTTVTPSMTAAVWIFLGFFDSQDSSRHSYNIGVTKIF